MFCFFIDFLKRGDWAHSEDWMASPRWPWNSCSFSSSAFMKKDCFYGMPWCCSPCIATFPIAFRSSGCFYGMQRNIILQGSQCLFEGQGWYDPSVLGWKNIKHVPSVASAPVLWWPTLLLICFACLTLLPTGLPVGCGWPVLCLPSFSVWGCPGQEISSDNPSAVPSPRHQIGSIFLPFPNACMPQRKDQTWMGANCPACFIQIQSFPKQSWVEKS